MDRQSLRVLEFPLIQRFLQSLTVTGPGWQQAETLQPITERHQIEVWLGQVTELKKYLQIGKTLPIGGIVSLGPMLDGVSETGQALTPHDLLDVDSTLGATRSLHKLIDDCRSEYPKLADLLVNLQPRADLETKIQGAIDSRGGIRDDASPELARIRKEIWGLRQRLHEELTEILEQQASQKRLQEKLVKQQWKVLFTTLLRVVLPVLWSPSPLFQLTIS
jgi:DNA mismatch repair protein MutS2